MILGHFNLAFKNVQRRKLRSWLTVIGILISITIIFLLISVSIGLNQSIQQQFQKLGTDKFFITPKGQVAGVGGSLTSNDVNAIKKVSGVKDFSYWSMGSVKVTVGDQVRYVNMIGIPLDHDSVFLQTGFIEIDTGRLLRQGDSGDVMLGSDYGEKDFIGKKISPGSKININGQDFQVKGILKSVGDAADDQGIIMSIGDFENLFPSKKNSYSEIAVQVSPGENLTEVANRVSDRLIREHGVNEKTKDFTVTTPQQLLGAFTTVLDLLTAFLLGIAGISLLVGGVGVANTMYTSVLERTKEIGVMKSVGARNSDILWIFTIEAGIIGLAGGVIGIILGTICAELATVIATNVLGSGLLQTALPWYLYIGCLAFSFGIGALSGMLPAWQASRIKPVDALRYE